MASSSKTGSAAANLVFSLAGYLKNDSNAPKLVLASQSPRRREILDLMGLSGLYSVDPSPLDESKMQQELQGLPPKEYTRRLAEAKALALAESYASSSDDMSTAKATIVLGSDTVVELDGKILEKPRDKEESRAMVRDLSGRSHQVHTGVAVYKLQEGDKISLSESFTETASVTFAPLGETDIDAYVESGEGMDKAGSYGIQGIGGQLVSEIKGDFFTVMGLPMHNTSIALCNAMRP